MKDNYFYFCMFFILIVIGAKLIYDKFDITAFHHARPTNVNKNLSEDECYVPDWNQISLKTVPNALDSKVAANNFVPEHDVFLLTAYVYRDKISIITTSHEPDSYIATCRYYDCQRRELQNFSYDTVVVPMEVVTCPRRYGADFVSISWPNISKPIEPIPLIYRVYEKPLHQLSVCVGPITRKSGKWLELVEFVEHHKLLGASYFYMTLFDTDAETRRVVDHYVSMGYAEYTPITLETQGLDRMFKLFQEQECYHRGRHHSKWVLNLEPNERLIYTGPDSFLSYLREMPSSIGELNFITKRIPQNEQMPENSTNLARLKIELMSGKYNKTSESSWFSFKRLIQPTLDKYHVMMVPKRVAHISSYQDHDQEGKTRTKLDFKRKTTTTSVL